MARRSLRPKTERKSKTQAQWLRAKVDEAYPGWNPVLAAIDILHKKQLTRRDRERFDQCMELAAFLQPKLKAVELSVGEGPGEGSGEITFKWRS